MKVTANRIRRCGTACTALLALAAAACDGNPASPTALTVGRSGAATDVKPSGPPPADYLLDLGPVLAPQDLLDPGDLSGTATVSGIVTGHASAGDLSVQVSGAVAGLAISNAMPLSSPGSACTLEERQLLQDAGLLGPASSISAQIDVIVEQAGRKPSREPELHVFLEGVTDLSGGRWNITFSHSMSYRPELSGGPDGLTAIQETGMIVFSRQGKGSNRTDLSVVCRTDATVTLGPQWAEVNEP